TARERAAIKTGRGRTVRLSSTRVELECADYLPEQSKVEIFIVWPARLDNCVGLKLCIAGVTVPARDNSIVVEIQRYEFRTRSERAFRISAGVALTPATVAQVRHGMGGRNDTHRFR